MSKKEELKKAKKLRQIEEEAGKAQVQILSKVNEEKDAQQEVQTAKRYKNDFDPRTVVPENGPQPGVTGKGTFSLYEKNKKKK